MSAAVNLKYLNTIPAQKRHVKCRVVALSYCRLENFRINLQKMREVLMPSYASKNDGTTQ